MSATLDDGLVVVRCLGNRKGIGKVPFTKIEGFKGRCMVIGAEFAERLVASSAQYEIAEPDESVIDTEAEFVEATTEPATEAKPRRTRKRR